MLVFLFLTACNSDFNTNQKDIKYHSSKKKLKSNNRKLKPKKEVTQNQKEDPNQRTNSLLDDLRNLIEKANENRKIYEKKLEKEPSNQYEILAFKELFWQDSSGESVTADTKRSKDYRKQTYATLNDININELKTFSKIVVSAKQTQILINIVRSFGAALDDVIVYLYPKKDNLDKLEIADLQKLKNSFEKLLSIKEGVSKMLNQLLLDYKNDTNSIQTDTAKLEPHIISFSNQMLEKQKEAEAIRTEICSIKNLKMY